MKCAAIFCKNKQTKTAVFSSIGFFRFPRNPILRQKWVSFCCLPAGYTITENTRVCSLHFNEDSVYRSKSDGRLRTLTGAVPVFEDVPDVSAAVPDFEACSAEYSETTSANAGDASQPMDSSQDALSPRNSTSTIGTTMTASSNELPESSADTKRLSAAPKNRLIRTVQRLTLRNGVQRRTIIKLEKRVKRLQNGRHESKNAASLIFNPEQVEMLQRGLQRVRKWSNKTITDSLEMRFACGVKGYNFLRNMKKHPLPSIRSQQKYLQYLHFDTGILHEFFSLFKNKVGCMSNAERDCGLILDEMGIDPSLSYCNNNKKFYGNATIPGQSGKATHALIFMLVGIHSRWKQVVAYYFTGNSIPPGFLKTVITDIIKQAEDIGLKVHFTTSDCGASNVRMWNDFGLQHAKNTVLKSSAVEHPVRSDTTLEIMPDAVHVFKSCVQGWVRNRYIYLPAQVVVDNGLTSNIVDVFHLKELVEFEKGKGLKMASRLTSKDVDFMKVSSLDAMKVINSYKLVNHDVSTALRFMSAELDRKDLLTTAFFIETIWRWFKLMTSRSPQVALSLSNMDAYKQAISFLNSFRSFISECQVGVKKVWKPWQAASILCTYSILRLQKHFLYSEQYPRLYTARFTQDCVENIFSLIRFKQRRPTALQFKDNLKLLTVSQFMMEIPHTSYEHDDRCWLMDFTTDIRNIAKPADSNNNSQEDNVIKIEYPNAVFDDDTLDNSQKNLIFHIAGYILKSVSKLFTVCEACFLPCISEDPFLKSFTRYSVLKDYTGNALIYVIEPVYMFFVAMERIFLDNIRSSMDNNTNISANLAVLMKSLQFSLFQDCHDIRTKIIDRFVLFRLRVYEPFKQRTNKLDSRSMAV